MTRLPRKSRHDAHDEWEIRTVLETLLRALVKKSSAVNRFRPTRPATKVSNLTSLRVNCVIIRSKRHRRIDDIIYPSLISEPSLALVLAGDCIGYGLSSPAKSDHAYFILHCLSASVLLRCHSLVL